MRGDLIESIIINYNSFEILWEECLEANLQPDIKGRIIGVQTQMQQFSLLFSLKLCEHILKQDSKRTHYQQLKHNMLLN